MKKLDKVELSGIVILSIGINFLAFTFFSAYNFLVGGMRTLSIGQTSDQAFEPLIEAMVRILYLGVMGWIASTLTTRGIQLFRKEREVTQLPQPSVKEEMKKESKETKPEEKPAEVE